MHHYPLNLLIHPAFIKGIPLIASYGLEILLPSHAAGERRSRSTVPASLVK